MGTFTEKDLADIAAQFHFPGLAAGTIVPTKPSEILVAAFKDEGYEGKACILFHKGPQLYEVHAYHCSCYGFEDQWDPEATTWEALLMRPEAIFGDEEIAEVAYTMADRQALPEERIIAMTAHTSEKIRKAARECLVRAYPPVKPRRKL